MKLSTAIVALVALCLLASPVLSAPTVPAPTDKTATEDKSRTVDDAVDETNEFVDSAEPAPEADQDSAALSLVHSADEIYSLLVGGAREEDPSAQAMSACVDACTFSFPPHTTPVTHLFGACRTGCDRGIAGSVSRQSAIEACPSECAALFFNEDSSAYACLHGCTVAFDMFATAQAQHGPARDFPAQPVGPLAAGPLPVLGRDEQLQRPTIDLPRLVRPPSVDNPAGAFDADDREDPALSDATVTVIEVERTAPGSVVYHVLGFFRQQHVPHVNAEGSQGPSTGLFDETQPCPFGDADHVHTRDGPVVWVRLVSYWHRLPTWVSHTAAVISFLLIALYIYYLIREALGDDEEDRARASACVERKGCVHHTCQCGRVTYVIPVDVESLPEYSSLAVEESPATDKVVTV